MEPALDTPAGFGQVIADATVNHEILVQRASTRLE
jgi:hypothetical protein